MSAFVIGIPVPEGLDPNVYRVRVVVDRLDGSELTAADLARIEAVYPSKRSRSAKPRAKPAASKAKPARKPRRAA